MTDPKEIYLAPACHAEMEEGQAMSAHPDSPNGKWARLGCTIEREPIPGHSGCNRRTIRTADGAEVPIVTLPGEDGHAAESRTASAMLAIGGEE